MSRNVVFLIPSLGNGGSEHRIMDLCKLLSKDGVGVSLYVYKHSGCIKKVEKNILITYDYPNRFYIKKLLSFRRFLINTRPDVVISFLTHANVFSLLSSLGLHHKKIISERGDFKYLDFRLKILSRVLFRQSDTIVFPSFKMLNNYPIKHLLNRTYIPNFIPAGDVLVDLKDDFNHWNLLTFSRFSRTKNITDLIRVYDLLKTKGFMGKLFIIGEGECENEIRELIIKLKLENEIEVHNWTDDVQEFSRNSAFFLSTSLTEGLSYSVMQAINFNLIPIVYDVDFGNDEIIRSTEVKLLFKVNDIDGFAESIFKLTGDAFTCRKVLIELRNHLYREYDERNILKLWLDLIEK